MGQINPFEIYQLTIGDEVSLGDFLPVKWAKSSNLINRSYIIHIASVGHLDCLVYLFEDYLCPWDVRICITAANNSHLDCLIYLHEKGCPWDRRTCIYAARNGHLDCLVYAHEAGCEWDRHTCYEAAAYVHLDCRRRN